MYGIKLYRGTVTNAVIGVVQVLNGLGQKIPKIMSVQTCTNSDVSLFVPPPDRY